MESKDDQDALNQAQARRSVFNFKMVGIPTGAELTFARDESLKAKVLSNRSIEFNGEVTSLSASAQKILGYDYGVAGTDYWKYEEETLDERRRRYEEEDGNPTEIELMNIDLETEQKFMGM